MVEEVLKTPWLVVCREKAWSHRDSQLGGRVASEKGGQNNVSMCD